MSDTIEQTQDQQVQQPDQQQAAPEVQQDKPRNDPPEWVLRRFGELTAARREAEDRAARIEAELNQIRQQPATQDQGQAAQVQHPNVQQLAEVMAEQLVNQRVQQQAMTAKVENIEKAGREQFGAEFDRSVQNLQIAGVGSPQFLEALTAIPNSEKVVRYLGDPNNIEEALRVASLPPVQMAIEMATLSQKAVKSLAKQVSNAPAPIQGIEGKGSVEGEPDINDTAAWISWRASKARKK